MPRYSGTLCSSSGAEEEVSEEEELDEELEEELEEVLEEETDDEDWLLLLEEDKDESALEDEEGVEGSGCDGLETDGVVLEVGLSIDKTEHEVRSIVVVVKRAESSASFFMTRISFYSADMSTEMITGGRPESVCADEEGEDEETTFDEVVDEGSLEEDVEDEEAFVSEEGAKSKERTTMRMMKIAIANPTKTHGRIRRMVCFRFSVEGVSSLTAGCSFVSKPCPK